MKDKQGRFVQDQKIQVVARGRLLSVGRIFPPDWANVRVVKTKQDDTTIWLKISKLDLLEA